jgi:hypothetical protein
MSPLRSRRMTGRDPSPLLMMALALVLAGALLALSAVLDAPWLAVIAVALVVFALVQRDRYLFRGAWFGLFVGVAAAVALGFVVEKLM